MTVDTKTRTAPDLASYSQTNLAALVTRLTEVNEKLREERDAALENCSYPYCPECTCEVRATDEDHCCTSCGTDVVWPTAQHIIERDQARADLEEAKRDHEETQAMMYADVKAAEARATRLEDEFRHTTISVYEDGELTDRCGKCSLGLRDQIHALAPTDTPPPCPSSPHIVVCDKGHLCRWLHRVPMIEGWIDKAHRAGSTKPTPTRLKEMTMGDRRWEEMEALQRSRADQVLRTGLRGFW